MEKENYVQEEKIITLKSKKVYDPFLRFLHLWNGLSVFSLILTVLLKGFIKQYPNGSDILFRIHTYIGYSLVVGIFARCIWGVVGPHHAKFKNMLFFRDWVTILKTRKYEPSLQWGHDKYASFVYLFFYLTMLYQVFSGLFFAARKFGMGPLSMFVLQSKEKNDFIHLLKEIHEIIFYISIVYVIIHVGMIIFHEIKNKRPIAQSMFSGFQYRKIKK